MQNLNESSWCGIKKDKIKFRRNIKLMSSCFGAKLGFWSEINDDKSSYILAMSSKESTFIGKRYLPSVVSFTDFM